MPANRVYFTLSGAPGTSGNFVCSAAVSGYRSLGAADDGKSFDVFVTDGTAWEVRTDCVYTHSTATLTRGTLEESSTGSAINLTAAAKVGVTLTEGRARAAIRDGRAASASGNALAGGPTRWAPLVLQTGYSGATAAVRINGGRYELRGRITKDSGPISSSALLATLPAALAAPAQTTMSMNTSTGAALVTVFADGSIGVGTVSGSPTWVDLDGLSVPFDRELRPRVGATGTLPVVRIDIDGGAPLNAPASDTYTAATITVEPNGHDVPALAAAACQVLGHGNSTWNAVPPKRSVKIKFGSALGLLGMPAAKAWRAISNVYDASLVHNAFVYELSRRVYQPWSPRYVMAELVLNGEYQGVYMMLEPIKSGADRLPVTIADDDAGDGLTGTYMLEIDAKDGSPPITTTPSSVPIIWDDPEPPTAAQISYIGTWLNTFDATLMGNDWLDPSLGYAKYVDMQSFADWYLLNEIVRNGDSAFNSSCKIYKARDSAGGKLHMGPTWDHDLSFGVGLFSGGISTPFWYTPAGWKTLPAVWYKRMIRDPAFRDVLFARWGVVRAALGGRDGVRAHIAQLVGRMAAAARADGLRWGFADDRPVIWAWCEEWLERRLAWLAPRLDRKAWITNLLTNPRPASGTTGYKATAGSGGVVVLSNQGSDLGVLGGKAVRGTWTSASSNVSAMNTERVDGLSPGDQYTVVAAIRSSFAQNCDLAATWYASGSYLSVSVLGPHSLQPNELVQAAYTVTIPVGANGLRISLRSRAAGMPINEWLELCGCMLVDGIVPALKYSDPRTGGGGFWGWDGTADASTSSGVPM